MDALDSAAVWKHLHSAEIEQPHGARPRRRFLRRLHQRRAVAVAPREETAAFVERDLLAHLKIPWSEAERSVPRLGSGFRLAEELERIREASQRLRAPRRQSGGAPNRSDGGGELLARRLYLRELLQAPRQRRSLSRSEPQQLLGPRQVAPRACHLRRR